MNSNRIFTGGVVAGAVAALLLVGFSVSRHPLSLQGDGKSLLITDATLLLLFAIAGAWGWRRQHAETTTVIGASVGLAAGAVLLANHLIEIFVSSRPFVLVIAPVLLIFVMLGAAGSTAWERTRSVAQAMLSGLWCAIVAMLILVCFVLAFNLVFEQRAELWLHEAFVASGTSDEKAFLVRNFLEAASEGLVRLPILAVFLSFAGALVNAWLSRRTRNEGLAVAVITPVLFAVGLTALWYANTQERATRPPFVLFGVLVSALALCSVHPVLSTLRRTHCQALSQRIL